MNATRYSRQQNHKQHICAAVLKPTRVFGLSGILNAAPAIPQLLSSGLENVWGDYVQPYTNPATFGSLAISGRAPARGEI